jgi:haloalkane dehalogenase
MAVTSKRVDVLGSYLHYLEAGKGDPIVFLHGNPTSSYLWRNVIPHLETQGRCLAVDLIGMGRSGKPLIEYRFFDHRRYLDAFFDALSLNRVTLVLHDWGTALGFDWARRHPQRVAAIAFMEALLREMTWNDFPENARALFQSFRTPGVGEKLILDENVFIEQLLPGAILRKLSAEEMDAYREPFLKREDRKPVWRWPQELPIEGQPADVVEAVKANAAYLSSSEVSKLLLTFEPGAIMRPDLVDWCRANIKNLEVRAVGKGLHFVQEDEPDSIGRTIAEWRQRVLAG